MEEKHGIYVPVSYKEIWRLIKEYHIFKNEQHKKKKTIMKIKRNVFMDYWTPHLEKVKDYIEKEFKKMYLK